MNQVKSGPSNAKYMIVGDAPSREDIQQNKAFAGVVGEELDKLLRENGIARDECYCTYVAPICMPFETSDKAFFATKTSGRYPEYKGKFPMPIVVLGIKALEADIKRIEPKKILLLGHLALWAVTGEWGVGKFRGSQLEYRVSFGADGIKSIPALATYPPQTVINMWQYRSIVARDLRRLKEWPEKRITSYITSPLMTQVEDICKALIEAASKEPITISADIETRDNHIACIGFAWSLTQAICIPLSSSSNTSKCYWTEEQEFEIYILIHSILTDPDIHIIWQNGCFDSQFIWEEWQYFPNYHDDTYLLQHTCFPEMKKSLDFISSMYCHHYKYWKEDGKKWEPKMGEEQLWVYNCDDCVNTLESYMALSGIVKHLDLVETHKQTTDLIEPVLFMMINGNKIDTEIRHNLTGEMDAAYKERLDWLAFVIGHPINPKSSKQLGQFFYDDMKYPEIKNRKAKRTTDIKALTKLAQKDPLADLLIENILECRSIGVYSSTFLKAELSQDERIRCSYNIAGTITSRFASSKNIFDEGTNLENVPRPNETKGNLKMPNVRAMFIPDKGYVIVGVDLDRADAQVVAWESGDEPLKEIFKTGEDVHAANALVIGSSRQVAKSFVHGTNYLGSAAGVARACGITLHKTKVGQAAWFAAHPAIKEWHNRVWLDLQTTRTLTTAFGRKRYFFGRVDRNLQKEAMAWVPQATVAQVTNIGLRKMYDDSSKGLLHEVDLQILNQVHDEIVFQFKYDKNTISDVLQRVKELMESTVIPYDEPLVIGVGFKTSLKSWGHIEDYIL